MIDALARAEILPGIMRRVVPLVKEAYWSMGAIHMGIPLDHT